MGKLDDVMRSNAAWGMLGGGMTTPMAIGSAVLLVASGLGLVNALGEDEFPVGMLLLTAVAAVFTLFTVQIELARIREVRRLRRAGLPVPDRGGMVALLSLTAPPLAPAGDPVTHVDGRPIPAPPTSAIPTGRRAAARHPGDDDEDRSVYLGGEQLTPQEFQRRLEQQLAQLGQHRAQAEERLAALAPADALLARRALVRDGSSAWLRAQQQGRALDAPGIDLAAGLARRPSASSAADAPTSPLPMGSPPAPQSTDRAEQRGRANRALGR